ncbi:MAG: NFACT family protein, partial [Desulfurococcales archaeon]|nr:NFACT family protein [Desulfurococcales archaeon]
MARKSMSILDLEAWLGKTGSALAGARLANIYQVGDVLLLRFKAPGLDLLVAAEPGRRIHATRRLQPPSTPRQTPLLALARKHLRGRRLEAIERLGWDRIAVLRFQGGHSLLVELVPRGVAALLDESGVILAASRYMEVRDRIVKPKQPYKPPPPPARNPLE